MRNPKFLKLMTFPFDGTGYIEPSWINMALIVRMHRDTTTETTTLFPITAEGMQGVILVTETPEEILAMVQPA